MILIWYFWHGASLLGRCLSPQHSYKVCRDGCALCWAHVTRVEEITRTVGCISRLVPRSPKDGSGPALHVSKLRHASKMHTAEDLYRCFFIYIYRKGVPRQLWSDYCTDSCWICKCMGEKRASSIPEHWSNRPLAPPTDTGLTQPLQKGALAAGRQWWARVEPDLNNFPNRIADFSARSPLARKRNTCMKIFD